MVAGLNWSGAIKRLMRDLPKSTATGPSAARIVIGSMMLLLKLFYLLGSLQVLIQKSADNALVL